MKLLTIRRLAACLPFVAVVLLVAWPVLADKGTSKDGPSDSKKPKAVNHFRGILVDAATKAEPDKDRLTDLVAAVKAIEDKGVMITPADCARRYPCQLYKKKGWRAVYKKCLKQVKHCNRRAKRSVKKRLRIAKAALAAEKKTGIDATFLVAVGRMESDFRPLQLVNSTCGKQSYAGKRSCAADCGITQYRITGRASYVKRYCKKLAKNYKLVFLKSAKELLANVVWCKKLLKKKYHHPMRRCVLNKYNQGPYYLTRKRCARRHRCWTYRQKDYETKDEWYRSFKQCKKRYYRCTNTASYWAKLSCFEYGARKKIRSKRTCRKCYRYKNIRKHYPKPKKALKKTSKQLAEK